MRRSINTHSGHRAGESESDLDPFWGVETEFAELGNGTLLELIEAPWSPQELALATYDPTFYARQARQARDEDEPRWDYGPEYEPNAPEQFPHGEEGPSDYGLEYRYQGRRYIPISRDNPIVKQVRLAHGIGRYAPGADELVRRIQLLLQKCLDLEDEYPFLMACFIVSTWLIDCLPIAPYLALVGLPQSGKTTALTLLRLLCRRSLLTADITSAAFYRACDLLNPTVLLDETATMGQKQALFHLLRTGTTRDVIALRQNHSYRTYGAKAFTWTELPADEALNSRCIVIPMQETWQATLERPLDSKIVEAADVLQIDLLMYRFKNYRKLSLPKIPGDERLHSRTRDLYQALALSLGGDSKLCVRLLECFERQQDLNREPLSPRRTAVLEALFERIHTHRGGEGCLIGEFTKEVNCALAQAGERRCLNPREVGGVLTTFGFINRRRTMNGWMMWLSPAAEKRIHFLMTVYGIRGSADVLSSPECMLYCESCQEFEEEGDEAL
ncbi:MAG: hypothetical protein WB949_15590 [Candidatus Acidiferrales bacterium]